MDLGQHGSVESHTAQPHGALGLCRSEIRLHSTRELLHGRAFQRIELRGCVMKMCFEM